MINIDNLISAATKEKSATLGLYRLVKAEFLRWVKDNPGKEFTDAVEQKILRKMVNQRKDSIDQYTAAGRKDLAEAESLELEILTPFLAKEASPEDIKEYTTEICDKLRDGGYNITMKDTKSIMAQVQEKYPGASGQIISGVVKYYC